MIRTMPWATALALALSSPSLASADDLAALSRDFWTWRAITQPITRDDLPRADRPHGWAPDWSAAAVEGRRTRLASLTARWRALADAQAPVFQLALGYRHPDEVRRHWYDSGVNEGLGTYAEEMMLQAGLFDDSPRTREMIYRYLRLRALRVEVDVQLALGGFTIAQAAEYLQGAAEVDARTAREEAAGFAATPGFAIGYVVGKLQINALLAAAARKQGSRFSLQEFHDFVWRNGNVPLSLQRLELLGDPSELQALDALPRSR